MAKLAGKTGLSRRKAKDKFENTERESQASDSVTTEKITTVSSRRNVTTGTSPVPMRLTENNKAELNLWLKELEDFSEKRITTAKLFRGLLRMRDKINKKKLLDAIKDAN